MLFRSSSKVFSSESVLHVKWATYWSFSFSISPSNEDSGLISFMMDWFDLLAVQRTQQSSPVPQFKSVNSSAPNFVPASSKANLLTLLVRKQNFLQVPSKEEGQLILKRPRLHDGFQGRVLKATSGVRV